MKYRKLAILLIFPFLISACQKEVANNNNNQIKVTAESVSGSTLKTTLNYPTVNWNTGDNIGLYSNYATTVSPAGIAKNVKYTVITGGNTTANFSSLTAISYDPAYSSTDFYAYYPWVTGTSLYSAVPVPDISAQIQNGTAGSEEANLGLYDFTIATPRIGLALNAAVNFTFKHQYAILKIGLTTNAPSPKNVLSSVTLTTTTKNIVWPPSSTVNITNEVYTPGAAAAKTVTLTLTPPMNLGTSVLYAYMLIRPDDFTADTNMSFVFTNSKGSTYTFPKTGANFQAGVLYTVTTIPIPFVNGPAGNYW